MEKKKVGGGFRTSDSERGDRAIVLVNGPT